ncbi:cytochrome bc1 complex cytochrome b subunit [Jiangella anatolica]|uniref:Cytochrome bc1 complex cytochrome b subunit n=1 Tax=Jiangella anatolica TaxID=2670374 RepID=A0A2W2C0N9_9ACTN|nr:cytochrome b N-terminal domain-containing protein [Jiangella anatolica]PZF79336.1 ubiquinol-cytochrome c reductase cytochrome b subunit [Jiangella anatolica]
MRDLTNHRMVTAVIGLADRHERPRPAVPRRWSDLFGPLAVASFLLVLVSGVLLAFWFEPSMRPVVYDGSYAPLRGVQMSEAYESTVRISMEVPGGLLVRQVHQWATLVFIAALSAQLLRVFLSGGFRGRRRIGWLLLLGLLVLGIVEAYLGHSLPDDLQSGTGLRVTEGYLLAAPVVGTWLSWIVFGGEFPGDQVIGRLYTVHVWVLPALIIGLAGLWLLLWYRRRPSPAEPVGDPPRQYAVRMGGLVLAFWGGIVAMAAAVQVNPVWLWGPFDPAQAPAGSRPPWYLGFLDGAVRLMPPWELDVFGYTLTLSVVVPVMVLPGVLLASLALYPWFEQWATGDRRDPSVLDRPRDMPVRTGLVAAFVAFYLVLWIAGGGDVVATLLHVPLEPLIRFLQVAVVVAPPLAFWAAKRICLGLRLRDLEELRHGHATGIVVVDAEGGFSELHRPLTAPEARRRAPRAELVGAGAPVDAHGVPNPHHRAGRALASRFYFADLPGNRPATADVQRKEHA